MSPTDDISTDGDDELDDEVLFGQLAEGERVEVTTRQSIARKLDVYVLAPGRVAWSDWRTRIGITILALFVFTGTVATQFVKEPSSNQAPQNHPPFQGGVDAITSEGGWIDFTQASLGPVSVPWIDLTFPLGSTNYGTPIGRQLIHSTPDMLEMVIAGAVLSVVLAVVFGVTAGYKGGRIDSMLMYLTDIMMTIPGLPLVIVVVSVWTPHDAWAVGMLLAIDSWPGLARALRSQVLTLREESYVEASRTMGIPSRTILSRDITPQLMPYILINAAQSGRRVIFEGVALYFLGVLPFTTANWGLMMDTAYTEAFALVNLNNFYQIFWPMAAVMIVSFGLILFAQGMDKVFNPRIRARHAKRAGADEEQPGD